MPNETRSTSIREMSRIREAKTDQVANAIPSLFRKSIESDDD